jgi:hypothetical protein
MDSKDKHACSKEKHKGLGKKKIDRLHVDRLFPEQTGFSRLAGFFRVGTRKIRSGHERQEEPGIEHILSII